MSVSHQTYVDTHTTYTLSKGDISSDKANNYLIIGKRESGKTTICIDIQQKIMKDRKNKELDALPNTIVYTSDGFESFYTDITDQIFTNMENLESIINGAKLNKATGTIIIFDNILELEHRILKSSMFQSFVMNARHYNTSIIIAISFSYGLTATLRANIDQIFLLNEMNDSELKKRYSNFGGMFQNFTTFEQIHKVCANNYIALLLDNKCAKAHWYRANIMIPELIIKCNKPLEIVIAPENFSLHSKLQILSDKLNQKITEIIEIRNELDHLIQLTNK